MEEEILRHGIGSKCQMLVGMNWYDAKLVMINIHTKEVGVIFDLDKTYLSNSYGRIRFNKEK